MNNELEGSSCGPVKVSPTFNWGKRKFSVRIAWVLAVQYFSQAPPIYQSKSLATITISLAVQGRTETDNN
jgi:hypothetical protein